MKATTISTQFKSVVHSYAAAIAKLILGVLLLPVVVMKLSVPELAFWAIASTLIGLIQLFDFGFGPTFARNLTSIVSGANKLKVVKLETDKVNKYVDLELLQKTVFTIRKFYKILAFISLIFAIVFSVFYTRYSEVSLLQFRLSWAVIYLYIFVFVYTSDVNVRALGYGLISEEKKSVITQNIVIMILGVSVLFITSKILYYFIAMLIGLIIQRVMLSNFIVKSDFEKEINIPKTIDQTNLSIIGPNAIKSGLTSISGYLATKGSILVAGFYLTEASIGYLGVLTTLFGIISQLSKTYTVAHMPELTQLFVFRKSNPIMRIFTRSNVIILLSFLTVVFTLKVIGLEQIMMMAHVDVTFSESMVIAFAIIFMLEAIHSNSAAFILATNYVPFVIPSFLTFIVMLLLCWFNMSFLQLTEWGFILAIGISQILYQNWKWPLLAYKLIKELDENSISNS